MSSGLYLENMKVRSIAACNQPHRYGNSSAIMGSHTPAEVTSPPLPQPIKAGTRFSDPRKMQG